MSHSTGRDGRQVAFRACAWVLGAVFAAGGGAWGEDASGGRAEWGPNYEWLRFEFLKRPCEYARDMIAEQFPPPDTPPEIKVYRQWPIVAVHARWAVSVKGWPEKYREDAVDLMLMYACDAQMYEYIFPDVIRSSRFTFPPDFLKQAQDPGYRLAKSLRGKEAEYEITAKAGLGASDYKIKTKIRIGLTEDEKTVFFHDCPEYISDHLKTRQYFFAGHDAGDRVHLDARIYCECAPRRLFQDEATRRVEGTSRYLIERIHSRLDNAPTQEEIEDYLQMVQKGYQDVDAFIKKYHVEAK